MKKSTKIIGLIALAAVIIYAIKKRNEKSEGLNNNDVAPPVEPLVVKPTNSQILNRTKGEVVDITLRRCTDPDTGKIIYVHGPCPTSVFTTYATNVNAIRK